MHQKMYNDVQWRKKWREVEKKPTDNRKQHNSDLKGRFMQPVKEKKCKKLSHVSSAAGQEATNSKQYLKGLNEGS